MKHTLAICSVLFTMGAAPNIDPTSRADVSFLRTSADRCLRDAQTSPEVAGCLVDENDELDRALADYLKEAERSLSPAARDVMGSRQAAWLKYRDLYFAPVPNAGVNGRPGERVATLKQRFNETMSRFHWVAEQVSEYREPKPFESLPSPDMRLRVLSAQREFYRGLRESVRWPSADLRIRSLGPRMKSELSTVLNAYLNSRLADLPEAQRTRALRGQQWWEGYRRAACDSDECWLRETRGRFGWVARLGSKGANQ